MRIMSTISGGCQCGAVRYETEATPLFAVHCQCADCKKSSGAGHVTAAAFPAGTVTFTGERKAYTSTADSGATVTREFCLECGGRLTFRSTGMPGMLAIVAGSLDDPGVITPTIAVYNKRHVAWDHLDPALPVFDAVPPRN
jgi:hypothetical protein